MLYEAENETKAKTCEAEAEAEATKFGLDIAALKSRLKTIGFYETLLSFSLIHYG